VWQPDAPKGAEKRGQKQPMTILITTSGSSHNTGVYHTNEDCRALSKTYREISKDVLATMDLRECKYCAGEINPTGGSRKYQRMASNAAKANE